MFIYTAAIALNKEITSERVKFDTTSHQLDELAEETRANPENESMTDAEIAERVETILLDKIQAGDTAAHFQLGLMYFHQVRFPNTIIWLPIFIR